MIPSPESQPASVQMARLLVASLVACGVRDVVYSPGSRSAPFAYAVAEAEAAGRLRAHIRLDERGAAFFAVGLSRAGAVGRGVPAPVALMATSGGAIAEYHAGVAEASHAELPLIVLSADRPFEMRGVGASQTTTQVGIFGSHCRDVWDIPAGQKPDSRVSALVARAVACAEGSLGGRPGPVQLNVGLREPLAPVSWPMGEVPAVRVPRIIPSPQSSVAWEDAVDPSLRTVLIAADGAPPQAALWAEKANIPLLAEPSSGATHGATWIPHQQAFLHADSPLRRDIEQVIVTGRPTLSRPVSALVSAPNIRLVVLARHHEWTDVSGSADVIVPSLSAAQRPHADAQWLPRWQEAAASATRHVNAFLDTPPAGHDVPGHKVAGADAGSLTMLAAMREVWQRNVGCLHVGASNVIRAADLVVATPAASPVVSNRGLAGIDGTIATACGLAAGLGQPVRAVMGDLTFFHDVSSLATTHGESEPHVQIIVFDDHGGGIFDSLEYSADHLRPLYSRWFDTTQQVSISHAAAAYGASYCRVTSRDQLCTILDRPVEGLSIVHIPIERPTRDMARIKQALTHPPHATQETSS